MSDAAEALSVAVNDGSGEPTTRFPKDGIADHVLHGADTVNPDGEGTKVAAHVRLVVPAGGQAAMLVRLTGSLDVGEIQQHLLQALSNAGFLEDEHFTRMEEQRRQEFRELAVRQPAHVQGNAPGEAVAAFDRNQ